MGRVIPADKEVCNPFFLATFTQISVAVANLVAISIKIAAPYSESAHQSINIFLTMVAEVAREHGWHPPKSLDLGENFKPEHTLFCHEL